MKVESCEDTIYLYIHKDKKGTIPMNDLDQLEDYFRKIFGRLKNYYRIMISGFYDIHIFLDEYYGYIIEIKKDLIDYYDMYENEVDMKIMIHNTEFLYKIEDPFILEKDLTNKIEFYLFRNFLYGKLKREISTIGFAKLLENSEVIYHTEEILKYGKELSL